MEDLEFLEERFGGWWFGVKFGRNEGRRDPLASHRMRFCEAIAESRTGPIVLTPKLMTCPGGAWSLGWNDDGDAIATTMAEKAGMDINVARKVIENSPRIKGVVDAVTVGTCETPDIVISYAQPEVAMQVIREWQALSGGALPMRVSGFMSVCGAVAAKTFCTGRMCISFGCPDARDHGKIGSDRLIIGLPMRQVARLRRRARAGTAANVLD